MDNSISFFREDILGDVIKIKGVGVVDKLHDIVLNFSINLYPIDIHYIKCKHL